MSTEYPSQTIFTSGSKLYISNTAIQYATEAAFNGGVTNGEITEIFDAATLTTTQLTQAVTDAQTYAGQAQDATINNQDSCSYSMPTLMSADILSIIGEFALGNVKDLTAFNSISLDFRTATTCIDSKVW